MQRATRAVYADPDTSDTSRVPAANPLRATTETTQGGTFTIDATRGRLSSDRNRTAAVALTLLVLLITCLMLPALLQYGRWVHRKIFKRASIGVTILLVAAVVAVSVARLLGLTQVWYIGVLVSVGIRSISHSLPLPTIFLWIFCVTFWFGAYLIVGRVFNHN